MLNELAVKCGTRAEEKGWHDRFHILSEDFVQQRDHTQGLAEDGVTDYRLDFARDYTDHLSSAVRDHVITKLALITCEVSEAIEEVRAGRDFDETYYSEGNKPEGVPSELADIIIRTLDLAYMLNIDIEQIVNEKLDFNSTRPRLHGKVV